MLFWKKLVLTQSTNSKSFCHSSPYLPTIGLLTYIIKAPPIILLVKTKLKMLSFCIYSITFLKVISFLRFFFFFITLLKDYNTRVKNIKTIIIFKKKRAFVGIVAVIDT